MTPIIGRRNETRGTILTGWAVLVAGTLVVGSLVLVLAARVTGYGVLRHEASVAVETRAIRFEDRADGVLAIYDAGASEPFELIEPGKPGFVRGSTRALRYGRRMNKAPDDTPFELVRWADGRFSLRDPADGHEIALEAFGHTNAEEFRRLMTLARAPTRAPIATPAATLAPTPARQAANVAIDVAKGAKP